MPEDGAWEDSWRKQLDGCGVLDVGKLFCVDSSSKFRRVLTEVTCYFKRKYLALEGRLLFDLVKRSKILISRYTVV